MAKYDPSNYESVKERKKRFRGDYPDGRIICRILNDDILEYALIEAVTYKDLAEQADGRPFSTGVALEVRDKELSVNSYGKEYATVNYSSWVENCEESAIGRALDNAGYSGNNKCSREEMKKAKNVESTAILTKARHRLRGCKSVEELEDVWTKVKNYTFNEFQLSTLQLEYETQKNLLKPQDIEV